MTYYLLHGGARSKDLPENDRFFKQFTSLVEKDTVAILMCYWARDKSRWDALLKRDSDKIKKQAKKDVSFTLLRDPDDLAKQLSLHDVLFVAGGEQEFIEPYLTHLSNLQELLSDKIYIGTSMGAFIVGRHYVLSFDPRSIHNGLGILPFSVLCHWDVEQKKEEKIATLKKHAPALLILTLNEGEYATFVH